MTISELFEIHQESEDLFKSLDDPYARNELAQSLTYTSGVIYLWEAADAAERAELDADINEAINFTKEKIQLAMEILDCPKTERNIG